MIFKRKTAMYLILLGMGLGITLSSSFNIINPRIEYVNYTEEEIKAKAKELGMVDIKENLSRIQEENQDADTPDDKEITDDVKNADFITFEINKGQVSEEIIDNLFAAGLISDKDEFENLAMKKDALKRFKYGIFKIQRNSDYETIIGILTK